MSYTEKELISKIDKSAENMHTFYKQDFINYRGKTTDTNKFYTEVIAKYLCDNLELLGKIPTITRESSYLVHTHDGKYDEKSNRDEEKIAMDMFCQSNNENEIFDGIGKIIDYQTPLKNTRSDEAGKIDLLSFDGQTIRVLELKKPDSDETMLRCVLEGYTYLKTLNTEKCKKDFNLPTSVDFMTSPFVFVNGIQHGEYKESSRTHLHNLMKLLDSTPFFIEKIEDKKYKVVI